MNIKKLSSLTIFFAILMMIYTGFAQFIAPACSIANWAEWELLGITKAQYINIHTSFMILFFIAMSVHLYYNFGKVLSYAKAKAKKAKRISIFTNEFVMALLLCISVLVGTLYEKSPFIDLMNFGENLEAQWEKRIGHPPFPHAELASLLTFSSKMGFDLERSKEIFIQNNIEFREPQNMGQIAKQNGVSPVFLYELLKKNFDTEIIKVVSFAYVDKQLVTDVAMVLNMSREELIKKIQQQGIESKAVDVFSAAQTKKNKTPVQIAKELGLKKKSISLL